VLSPIENLNSRRICFTRGFEHNFLFKVRSNLLRYPLYSMLFLILGSVTFFAIIVMIYERPYYHFTIGMEASPNTVFYQFGSLRASMWYTIISMTTVGYWDEVASTPIGRFFAIITILAGAYIMSIVIAVQASIFQLNSVGKQAVI